VIVFGWTHKLPEGNLYSISYRAFYTLVRQVLGHNIIQVVRDRDDHQLQSLLCGVLPTLQDHEVHFQCGDVVEGW